MLRPGIIPVGVFSDHDIKTVAGLLLSGVIDIAQLHGGETEEYILRLKALCPKPVIKAVRVRCKADIEKWRSSSADYLLLDGGAGSGRGFDWNLIVDTGRPFFLAGASITETSAPRVN
jgi:phosphoribosylanthranilate isomerase